MLRSSTKGAIPEIRFHMPTVSDSAKMLFVDIIWYCAQILAFWKTPPVFFKEKKEFQVLVFYRYSWKWHGYVKWFL